MANSATLAPGDIVTYSITVNGTAILSSLNVLSVYVEYGVNRIPVARVTILDGDPSSGEFAASSSSTFVPGATISIEAGYDSSNAIIFQGIITGQSLRINCDVGAILEIDCRDEAVRMIVGRKCLTFSQQKDSDIITSIIGSYPGLSANVTATTTAWPEQVQYYVTDWDFILTRAEANGMVVTVANGKVTVASPGANTSPVVTVQYGDNLLGLSADLDAISQLGSASAATWDYKQQQVATGQASNSYSGPGNLSSKTLSQVVGLSEYKLQTSASLETADLTNWSQAQLVKSSYSKIQGEAKLNGTSLLMPGNYITLKGLGDRFNGDHFISGIVHDISQGNWITQASLGLPNEWFIQEPDVIAPPASGLLPGARGLMMGTVKQMYQDPDSQYRILVNVPLFDQNGAGIWARLAGFYATSGAGSYFLPEVGDEVVIGFLNEDPRYPIILGSLYSSTTNKPYQGLDPDEKNQMKAIVSKSGIYMQFDDVNKVLTIATPDKNTIILSDKDKKITIQDENNNSIVMSSSGINISSAGDINITADKNVTIKGTQGITINSSAGDVATNGVNIKETAQSQFAAQGSMTASVQGGTELTLKGAIVMIN